MEGISRYSQEVEGIRFIGLLFLLFAVDMLPLVSLGGSLQLAWGQFEAECEAAEIKISTSKSEAMVLCLSLVGGVPTLGQG